MFSLKYVLYTFVVLQKIWFIIIALPEGGAANMHKECL